jgi:hypothetical protein
MNFTLVFGWFKGPEQEEGKWKTVLVLLDEHRGAKRLAKEQWGNKKPKIVKAVSIKAPQGRMVDCTRRPMWSN